MRTTFWVEPFDEGSSHPPRATRTGESVFVFLDRETALGGPIDLDVAARLDEIGDALKEAANLMWQALHDDAQPRLRRRSRAPERGRR